MYKAKQQKKAVSHTFTVPAKKIKQYNDWENFIEKMSKHNLSMQRFSMLQNKSNSIIQRIRNKNKKEIKTLIELNQELLHLNPSISGISSDMIFGFGININVNLLNAIISRSKIELYDGIKRSDILNSLKDVASTVLNDTPINCIYDTHGDKHFPGGPSVGTKFTAKKEIVNPQIENYIQQIKGRIRLFSKDRALYLTLPGIFCPRGYSDLTVQIVYNFKNDTIIYHGYPDNVDRYSLSLTKGDVDIDSQNLQSEE